MAVVGAPHDVGGREEEWVADPGNDEGSHLRAAIAKAADSRVTAVAGQARFPADADGIWAHEGPFRCGATADVEPLTAAAVSFR